MASELSTLIDRELELVDREVGSMEHDLHERVDRMQNAKRICCGMNLKSTTFAGFLVVFFLLILVSLLGDAHVKLNQETGAVLWRRQYDLPFQHIAFLCYDDGIVLASGTYTAGSGDGTFWYHYRACAADDGMSVWTYDLDTTLWANELHGYATNHGGNDKHPIIINGNVYTRHIVLDLQTGAIVPGFPRSSYGEAAGGLGWIPSTNCADFSASTTHLFGRYDRDAVIYPLNNPGSVAKLSSEVRPGCYITALPAGGVILLPAMSAGCTCYDYTLETSVTWQPQ